jgi:hypothetical protein
MVTLSPLFNLNRKFSIMKNEAIEALRLFKEQLNQQPTQVDIESLRYPPREHREIKPIEVQEQPPSKQKGVNFNYPDHIKPLKDRIMSALSNGNRTAEAVANYCKEPDVKLVNLQLGRWVSRGLIGRQTNPQSGITRFYPFEEAKKRGILQKPAPINRKKAKAYTTFDKPVKFVKPKSLEKWNAAKDTRQMDLFDNPPSLYTAEFLEKRVVEWQKEARKLANENEDLKQKLSDAQMKLIEARQTRDVTSEVTEVMKEVMDLRATVAYLESKLFGGK